MVPDVGLTINPALAHEKVPLGVPVNDTVGSALPANLQTVAGE
jgi:hypothetical protein